ncbi:unnamed protein product [Medioppia subpectinata]|uniref:Uncharacterized protein n=1 Tax=Medioppia subpectinata TaxID=1979941 RepID=A0A7R9KE76_9ACAR|nr:unnamed protein product [Medioppia subpectinata]CAG2100668.1 unnamed protein product [Medioppia subpectinata]
MSSATMMSSAPKSVRVANTRIVETNSSGIVTIVIDDDDHYRHTAVDDHFSDTNSYDECSPSAATAPTGRPHIGVRSPVCTPGSPKFINSENSQNILIKENKTNVIVVNSGGGNTGLGFTSPHFRSGQLCLSPSTSCCSPHTDVRTHHNIVAKQQTHYVVVNKPKPPSTATSTSTTSSPMTSSMSSSSPFSPKLSPNKLRLWQPNNASTPATAAGAPTTPRSPQVLVSTRSRSQTACLPPEDVESDCMDDRMFFKYLNLIPRRESMTKTELTLRIEWPLRKVTRIPKPETDSNGKILLANFKLIREPIKSTPDMKQVLSERKVQWYREAQQYNERLQRFKQNLPRNLEVRHKCQSDLEGLHKRLMAEKSRLNVDEEKYRRLKTVEQNQRLHKEELIQELEGYTNAFEISSLMGRRVRLSSDNSSLNPLQIFNLNIRNENYCNQLKTIRDLIAATVPQNAKLSTRITRSNTGFAGIDKMWGPRSESHEYSFTRKQRLERYQRLETGLNWKSRLVKKHCKSIDVEVDKITRCPCCLELVEPEWGHSCRDSDEESIAGDISSINGSEFGVQSENTFNDDEVISTNSEVVTIGNVVCYECGRQDCLGNCVDFNGTTVTQISITEPSAVHSSVAAPIIVFSANEGLLPVKSEIEDKIMVQKVPILYDKSNNHSHSRRSDSIPIKRINDQSLRSAADKSAEPMESDDDIVIINEVRSEPHIIGSSPRPLKRMGEPVVIKFLPSNTDTKPSIKRKFSDKRLRSHSRTNSDEIIVKKIK